MASGLLAPILSRVEVQVGRGARLLIGGHHVNFALEAPSFLHVEGQLLESILEGAGALLDLGFSKVGFVVVEGVYGVRELLEWVGPSFGRCGRALSTQNSSQAGSRPDCREEWPLPVPPRPRSRSRSGARASPRSCPP